MLERTFFSSLSAGGSLLELHKFLQHYYGLIVYYTIRYAFEAMIQLALYVPLEKITIKLPIKLLAIIIIDWFFKQPYVFHFKTFDHLLPATDQGI